MILGHPFSLILTGTWPYTVSLCLFGSLFVCGSKITPTFGEESDFIVGVTISSAHFLSKEWILASFVVSINSTGEKPSCQSLGLLHWQPFFLLISLTLSLFFSRDPTTSFHSPSLEFQNSSSSPLKQGEVLLSTWELNEMVHIKYLEQFLAQKWSQSFWIYTPLCV